MAHKRQPSGDSRLRRAEISTHHSLAGPYLSAYAEEMDGLARKPAPQLQRLAIHGFGFRRRPPSDQPQVERLMAAARGVIR
jgi:hypothetical protein